MCWLGLEQVGATELLLAKTLLLEERVALTVFNGVLLLRSLTGLHARCALVKQSGVCVAELVSSIFLTLTFVPLDAKAVLREEFPRDTVDESSSSSFRSSTRNTTTCKFSDWDPLNLLS